MIRLVVFGLTAILGALGWGGLSDHESADTLRAEAQLEKMLNLQTEYGQYIQQDLAHQAGCDSALESFGRHREDNVDWGHVLRRCHSEGLSVWDDPSLPAEDPNQ